MTRYICASGKFSQEDIKNRLDTEIRNEQTFGIQYWPIFELATGELIGCYELGFHLRKKCWGKGYALEAAGRAVNYSFDEQKAVKLYAGHHPENSASQKLLTKLEFRYIGTNYYEPTGLCHPSYERKKAD